MTGAINRCTTFMNFKDNRVNEQNNFTNHLPKLVFGTSGLGNLFVALDDESKCAIIKECIRLSDTPVVFDTAGKYGAG